MDQTMQHTALIIIDVQEAIDHTVWGRRNNPHAETNMGQILRAWRKQDWPVVHIRHDSVQEGSPYTRDSETHAFKPVVAPEAGETVIGKSTNNAFIGTTLENHLREQKIRQLIVVGVLTQHSVDTTARMAASLGFDVTIVSDATAATDTEDYYGATWRAEDVHALALAHFMADYGTVMGTEEILQAIDTAD